MSNIKEVNGKPRLHVSLSTYYLEYGRHLARLRRRRRRRRGRAYAPTSNREVKLSVQWNQNICICSE